MIGGRCCCEVEFPVFPRRHESGSSRGIRMYSDCQTGRADTAFGTLSRFTHQRGKADIIDSWVSVKVLASIFVTPVNIGTSW